MSFDSKGDTECAPAAAPAEGSDPCPYFPIIHETFERVGDKWTLIVSKWPAQTTYDESNRAALWGAYEYTPERDIVRAPMRIERLPHAYEQLSWEFLDITPKGGLIALVWDRKLASVAFTVAN